MECVLTSQPPHVSDCLNSPAELISSLPVTKLCPQLSLHPERATNILNIQLSKEALTEQNPGLFSLFLSQLVLLPSELEASTKGFSFDTGTARDCSIASLQPHLPLYHICR